MLTIYINKNTEALLREVAKRERRSMSDTVRVLVEDAYEKFLQKKVPIDTQVLPSAPQA